MEMSNLEALDWLIIAIYFILSLVIGLVFTKRAGKNLTNFFLGGRNMTWWLAGVSMVATTFAADTPLAVTELVAKNGIAGNWLWWNALIGGMLTVFFFAKLWRRAEILTDLELIELRYSGGAAKFLRGFRAIYLGMFMNAIIIGWVNSALMKILIVFFNLTPDEALLYVAGAMVLTVIYSSMSGLLGVAVTDFVQFFIAIIGCTVLAVVVVNSEEIGGISGLKAQLPGWSMQFFPELAIDEPIEEIGATLTIGLATFFSFIAIQWWSSWYPGAEPGGGGYIAQRMMSTKNEKHSIYATLFFQIGHYCLRPWPWILVGLCSIVLYPELTAENKGLGFIMAMKQFLPAGLKGLLLVAFFSAYMSTISTQLNWGASYLINDFYKRFIAGGEEKGMVAASRIATILMMLFALFITTLIDTISGAWYFILQASAGLGLVLILRWYWWRVNAWSEVAATVTPLVVLGILTFLTSIADPTPIDASSPEDVSVFTSFSRWIDVKPRAFFLITGLTTVSWITVTFLTRPTHKDVLENFYRRIRPQGAWKPVREALSLPPMQSNIPMLLVCWFLAVVFTYSTLFFTGKLIFQEWTMTFIYLASAVVSGVLLIVVSKKVKVFED